MKLLQELRTLFHAAAMMNLSKNRHSTSFGWLVTEEEEEEDEKSGRDEKGGKRPRYGCNDTNQYL